MSKAICKSLGILGASLLLVMSLPTQAAYVVTPVGGANDATALANNLFSGGSGITLVSATYTGANAASGTFTGGIFGVANGVVLSSGNAQTLGSNNNGVAGYAPLQGLNGGLATFDASVLDIKFIPTGSQITFSFVFGSEEYPNFVDSSFNDVFAFFVNGTTPANNKALIPGTSTPVGINTVNCGNSSGAGLKPNCNLFIDNRNGDKGVPQSTFGGWTQVFTFTAAVNANVQNELILAIADTSDGNLDSAAFIKSGSFSVCGGPGQPPCGNPVPEPESLLLLAAGLMAATGARRWRRK